MAGRAHSKASTIMLALIKLKMCLLTSASSTNVVSADGYLSAANAGR